MAALIAGLCKAELLQQFHSDLDAACLGRGVWYRSGVLFNLGAHVDSDGGLGDPHAPRGNLDIAQPVGVPSLEDRFPLERSGFMHVSLLRDESVGV
jgi:hypothetical protein